MEWSRGVEWSGVWSGVESTLNSCNMGRAFEMQLRNEFTLKTLPLWPFNLEQVTCMLTSKMQRKRVTKTLNFGTWGDFMVRIPF